MLITAHVQPNAKKSEIVGWLDETTVKIKLSAPAKEGKANKELIDFLSKTMKIPKISIQIVRGRATRVKHLEVPDSAIFSLKNVDTF